MNRQSMIGIVRRFPQQKVLVAGDLMFDEFIWGRVNRISPEAPVPIVHVTSESCFPGGAANVARNLREVAVDVRMMGLVGHDDYGQRLLDLLHTGGIRIDGVQQSATWQTIVKTRIIARNQQVVRVDRERLNSGTVAHTAAALEILNRLVPEVDAVILSDYAKGYLNQQIVDRAMMLARGAGVTVTVDPHPSNPLDWKGAAAVKPNREEAFRAAGLSITPPVDPVEQDSPLLDAGKVLLGKWNAQLIVITLGEQGMLLLRRDQPFYHIPTRGREIFDVSGAGDTAMAFLTLALSAGADAVLAAEIANHASGIVVAKVGTATVNEQELIASIEDDAANTAG
jgi:D-beta-D-heptose 7-phosphate kinase/D-beta-D-heptose 1-phosphate adenosyltransferase